MVTLPSWFATYSPTITAAANQYGVPPSLLAGLIQQESGGNPNAVGSSGELGLTQILPQNDQALGITNPLDPTQQIFGAAKLLAQNFASTGDWFDALREYNGGGNYANIPATSNYANNVEALAANFGGDFTTNMANAATGSSGTGSTNGSSSTAGPLDFINEVEDFFVRFGLLIAGGVIIVVALWQLLSDQGVVPSPGDAAKAVGKVAGEAALA